MSVTFSCENCGKSFTLDDKFAGKKGRCKQCGTVMLIPGTGPTRSSTPNSVQRGLSPSRRAPEPSRAPVAGRLKRHDDLGPRKSSVIEADEDDFVVSAESLGFERELPSDAETLERIIPPRAPKRVKPLRMRKQYRSDEESGIMLMGRILLGLAIGTVGTFVVLGLMQAKWKPLTPGISQKSELEGLIQARITLNQDLAEMLEKVDDVPAAQTASPAINQKVRAMTVNLRQMRQAKGLQRDIDALKAAYIDRINKATNRLLAVVLAMNQRPEVREALQWDDAMTELANEEQLYNQTVSGSGTRTTTTTNNGVTTTTRSTIPPPTIPPPNMNPSPAPRPGPPPFPNRGTRPGRRGFGPRP